MRNTRDVLEVVCGVVEIEDNIETEKHKDDIPLECKSVCHNVFRLTKHIVDLNTRAQASKTAKYAVAEQLDAIMCAHKSVLRAYSINKAFSGTAFLLGPEILASNWHAINASRFPICFSNSTDLTFEKFCLKLRSVDANFDGLKNVKLAKERSVLYSGYHINPALNHPVKRTQLCKPKLDPILGVPGDFELFDFALIHVHYPSMPRVLFIPSVHFIQPESNIATIGFPGTELLDKHLMQGLKIPKNYEASLPPFDYLKDIFFNFGKKCVSVGKTSYPFGLNGNEWRENNNFTADINQYSIISNETVFFGNSGGPVICLDNCERKKILDKNNGEWELVEFIGIHSGGEFINCVDCLCKMPSEREFQDPFNLQACFSCQKNPKREKKSMKYNYSISVHHPDFVKCYIEIIVPRLCEFFQELPNSVREYISLHTQSNA